MVQPPAWKTVTRSHFDTHTGSQIRIHCCSSCLVLLSIFCHIHNETSTPHHRRVIDQSTLPFEPPILPHPLKLFLFSLSQMLNPLSTTLGEFRLLSMRLYGLSLHICLTFALQPVSAEESYPNHSNSSCLLSFSICKFLHSPLVPGIPLVICQSVTDLMILFSRR